jgi:hypothetical protein
MRTICRECKGGAICEHNKVRGRCAKCGGSQICQHGVYKLSCVACDGTLICEHKKRREYCVLCGGSQMCVHKKVIQYCSICDGSQLCEHNIARSQCRECNGGGICEHGKSRGRCKECGGSQICPHNILKQSCFECGGSQRCIHGKYKNGCIECGGSRLCKTVGCGIYGQPKYNGHCLRCCIYLFPDLPISRNYKTKENMVVDTIKESFPDFQWICDRRVNGGSSGRRPDLLLHMETHVIIVEVDENKHSNYECICENKRLMEISQDLNHKPIIFIRFNPDDYIDNHGNKINSCWKVNKLGIFKLFDIDQWNYRIHMLKEQIVYWMHNASDKTVEIIELFY